MLPRGEKRRKQRLGVYPVIGVALILFENSNNLDNSLDKVMNKDYNI